MTLFIFLEFHITLFLLFYALLTIISLFMMQIMSICVFTRDGKVNTLIACNYTFNYNNLMSNSFIRFGQMADSLRNVNGSVNEWAIKSLVHKIHSKRRFIQK